MRIAYVFTDGRKSRLERIRRGESLPKEFFFGADALSERHTVDIYEIADFCEDRPSWILELCSRILVKTTGLASCRHRLSRLKIEKLTQYDFIIATNEHIALGIASFLRSLGRPKMFFFVMGMLAGLERRSWWSRALGRSCYGALIDSAQRVIFVGEGEMAYARTLFPRKASKFSVVPFPVDHQFWCPSQTVAQPYVLFIGNDQQRDYGLLLDIIREMPEVSFKIITRNLQPGDMPINVELIKGDWKREILLDKDIREYIQKAQCLILPLKDSFQPSGQSVAQQAMSCGKAVLISRTKGFWSPADFELGEVIFVERPDKELWIKKIYDLLNTPRHQQAIGCQARDLMVKSFSIEHFSRKIEGFF